MDISPLFWRFVHVVTTRSEEKYLSSRVFQKVMSAWKRNGKVFLHTSYLPYLPYEANTYVIFDSIEIAFRTLYEMYERHAAFTMEAKTLANAYKIMQYQCHSFCNVQLLCDALQEICMDSN
jgi:16S rRNA A1518/A1519 N6-dimethyltransferase RsmA/KsgA/DIM1 with predicted DNA glycosylase/AP lyase activity